MGPPCRLGDSKVVNGRLHPRSIRDDRVITLPSHPLAQGTKVPHDGSQTKSQRPNPPIARSTPTRTSTPSTPRRGPPRQSTTPSSPHAACRNCHRRVTGLDRLTLRLPIAYRRHIDPTSQIGCIAGEDWTSGSHLVSGRAKTVEVTESK